MIYTPCRHKPRYGDAGIIPGHPLTPDFALLLNESGGNNVADTIRGGQYPFDATYTPSWQSGRLLFDSEKEHINGPALNNIIEAGGSGTIFFRWKYTNTPTSLFCFFYCPSDAFMFTSLNDTTSFGFRFWVGGSYGTKIIDFTGVKSVAITWISSGGSTTWNLYLDGIDMGAGNTIAAEVPTNSNTFDIGGEGDAGGRWSGGIIDDFYIYKHVLSCAEIAQLSAKPHCWLYSRSEQLIRSVWAVGGGGTIEFSGDHGPVYPHSGTMTLQQNFTGAHAPAYSHAGAIELELDFTGNHSPEYVHAGVMETTYLFPGTHEPEYSHAGEMSIEYQITGNHGPVYRHAGEMTLEGDDTIYFEGYHGPVYLHTGVISVEYLITGNHSPVYGHAGQMTSFDMLNAIIFPVLNMDAQKIFPVKIMPEQIEFDTRDLDETIIFPVKEE